MKNNKVAKILQLPYAVLNTSNIVVSEKHMQRLMWDTYQNCIKPRTIDTTCSEYPSLLMTARVEGE